MSEIIQDKSFSELLNLVLLSTIAVLLGYIWNNRPKEEKENLLNIESKDDLPSQESVLNLIKARRSIMPKDLSPGGKLSEAEVEYLMECANWAPTHHNTQPWRYVVIAGTNNIIDYFDFLEDWYRDHREEVTAGDLEKFTAKADALKSILPTNMSHMFVICMKRQALPDKLLPEWEEICATACSVQNLHLGLTGLKGCGGFWSSHTWCKHARDSVQFKEFLGLGPEDRVLGAFMCGKVGSGKSFKSTRSHWSKKVTFRVDENEN